jgi:HSP20 family protein
MAIERWRPTQGLMRGPFGELSRMEREMESVFGRLFRDRPFARFSGEGQAAAPTVDIVGKKDEVVLRADLPGLEQKDVDISIQEGMLTIRGSRKGEEETKEENHYCCERWWGGFERSFTLPAGVDAERTSATFKNGVLEVHLPKVEQAKGKKIEIKAE